MKLSACKSTAWQRGVGLFASWAFFLTIIAGGATVETANASVRNCGKVKNTHVRAVKGHVSRSECRRVARFAISHIGSPPRCGQWNTPSPACRTGNWRCWWPTAGTQTRESLVYFCFIPKRISTPDEQSYKPATYRKLIKLSQARYRGTWSRCGSSATANLYEMRVLRMGCRKGWRVSQAIGERFQRCIMKGCLAAGFRCGRGSGIVKGYEGGDIVCKRGKQRVKFGYGG